MGRGGAKPVKMERERKMGHDKVDVEGDKGWMK